MSIDHDQLFKQLIGTFFWEFLKLFCPDVCAYLDPVSLTLLDKEVYTDLLEGARRAMDLVARAQFREQETVHIENQAQHKYNASFAKLIAALIPSEIGVGSAISTSYDG
ncbi:RpnC/YadD family protein [Anthocerotibacter panamensis]|uniref:hypothetical protein n=1 Tax=Anthocerotibacter panamensis TaxID=2857077 RepID=UPI001C404D22|nr:hypothetical protein [Anthocerotibacter panamensis]